MPPLQSHQLTAMPAYVHPPAPGLDLPPGMSQPQQFLCLEPLTNPQTKSRKHSLSPKQFG